MDWMTDWIFDLLFSLQSTICFIIDFIKEIFYMLAGIESVSIDGEETDLLTNLINSDTVRTSFLIIMLIAVILLFVFVIVSIIRSEYAHGEKKKNKATIFNKGFQSFLIFLIVPFVLLAGISLTNTVMSSINDSMNPFVLETGGSSTIGGQILVTGAYTAYIGSDDEREEIEYKFISGELDYTDYDIVSEYYNIRDIDYFIGIIGSLVILIMFVMSSITFIQRIFDIILLYLVSPISISTIPLDDGVRFKQWREMMIGKVLSAYGIILSMNLFFIIIPQVNEIVFFTNDFKNGIINILFLIGGAFAVTKANIVIANLTGSNAGGQETRELMANLRTGRNITRSVGATALGVGGAILGGRNFYDANKKGGLIQGAKSTMKNQTSNAIDKPTADNQKGRYSKMASRLATMPLGTMKDLVNGGVVGATRNIGGRVRNAFTGNTTFNHSQKKLKKNDKPTEVPKEKETNN